MTNRKVLSLVFVVLLLGWAAGLVAEIKKGQPSIKISTEIDSAGKRRVSICCTPKEQYGSNQSCAYEWNGPAKVDSYQTSVRLLCDALKKEAPVVAQNGEWILSRRTKSQQPLFLINCNTSLAWPEEPPSSSPLPTDSQSPATSASVPPSSSSSDPQASSTDSKEKGLGQRLKSLEKAFLLQEKALQVLEDEFKRRGAADRERDKAIESLQKELRALEEEQKNSCIRLEDRHQGNDEVMISVAGSVLRFLKVKPQESAVPIGLSEAKASEFLAEAQAQDDKPIFPHVYLAVPEAFREVEPFFLQDRLIDPFLYTRLTGNKDAKRVSYQDVTRFIADLNARCSGRARFALPTEEQFVAAAQRVYDPVADGLRPCETLRKEDLRSSITELFGHAWQLTGSPCRPFGDPPKMSCPDDSYVRKGGAPSSTNPLECMPEYRSPAPSDVNQKETSFRLALVE
jgi:hypothetical protein